MDWNLLVAVGSLIAGIAGAWFAYVAVRGRAGRRSAGPAVGLSPAAGSYDAFISYASGDQDKAEWLAKRLQDRGLRVFLAKWIGPGLVEYAEKERALSAAANGVLLFSGATMSQPAIRDEYAALLDRVHNGGRRFIPVLIEDVELPPFARIRKPLDLTDKRNDDTNLDLLVRALRS